MAEDQVNDLSDLNLIALNEFKRLVEQNKDLSAEWKSALLSLISNGIPKNLEPLEKLAGGKPDDTTKTD